MVRATLVAILSPAVARTQPLSPKTRRFAGGFFQDCQSVPAAHCRCPACPLELQSRCAYLARKHPKGICFSICSYTRPFMPFSCPAYPCAYFYGLRNTFWIVPQWSLRPTLSLVTFSVLPSVPEVPRSCRQLHLHHAQGRQTVWQKCCNVEQGARAGRESQPRKKAKEVGRRRLQEDQFLRRAHACHGIRGSVCNDG